MDTDNNQHYILQIQTAKMRVVIAHYSLIIVKRFRTSKLCARKPVATAEQQNPLT